MKYLKIIFINLILILFIFFLFDISVYYRQLYMSHIYNPINDNISYFKHITRDLSYKKIKKIMFEEIKYPKAENITNKGRPYVLFGCSFVQGSRLTEDKNFSHKLALFSNAPVYNRASGGWGTQHMLFQLKSEEFYRIINTQQTNPIFIYTYIYDHTNRIHIAKAPIIFGGYPTFIYKQKNNTLIIDNFSQFIFRFPLLAHIKEFLYQFKTSGEKANNLKIHILEAKKEIDKHYKNTDFIVLAYSYDYNAEFLSIVPDLTKNGIKVVFFESLTGLNSEDKSFVISQNDSHPNEKAWDLLIPKLYNYINNADENEIAKQAKFKQDLVQKHYNPTYRIELKDAFKSLYKPSGFSLCFIDDELINNKKISKFRTSLAYINWCIGNLFETSIFNFLTLHFVNIAIKINPYNEKYKLYKHRLSEKI